MCRTMKASERDSQAAQRQECECDGVVHEGAAAANPLHCLTLLKVILTWRPQQKLQLQEIILWTPARARLVQDCVLLPLTT